MVTPALSPDELLRRARRLRLVLTDCDGVLTDGSVYYGEGGEALRRFNVRDGMGVERLREAGVHTAICTREPSVTIAQRSEKLRLPWLFLGVRDKAAHLEVILQETGLTLPDLAYIGDDVNDLGILAAVGAEGLTGCPADAMPDVHPVCHYVCSARGGAGAFRDFAEWLLALRRGETASRSGR